VTLALVLAGIAISYLFAASIERRVQEDLSARLNRVVALLEPGDLEASLARPLEDPRYDTPFGGLYWLVDGLSSEEGARSRSLWDFDLTVPTGDLAGGQPAYLLLPGPSGQELAALARVISFPGEARYLVVVAEDRAPIAASIDRFSRELTLGLLILGAVLVAAAWLQVSLGLRPLNAIREGLQRVRTGKERSLSGDFPSEVEPLVEEVNSLVRSHDLAIDFARARAADLAHGLKTPLAVLGTTAEDLRAKGEAETARLLDELTAGMSDRIDYQLRLSRLRIRTRSQVYSASVEETVSRTVEVLKRTREGEGLRWEMAIEPGLHVDLDRHDLIELLGVILENAAKWGRSVVAIEAKREGAMVAISVEDDGPGVPEGLAEQLGKRGHRLDEGKPGAGLGLAIAREIVGLNEGTIAFGQSARGGFAVRLELPAAA
jgi:signal transduction histidine kinase